MGLEIDPKKEAGRVERGVRRMRGDKRGRRGEHSPLEDSPFKSSVESGGCVRIKDVEWE